MPQLTSRVVSPNGDGIRQPDRLQLDTAICPYLGMDEDPETRHAFPSRQNRCYGHAAAQKIEITQQQQYCLSGAHAACPVYQGKRQPQKSRTLAPRRRRHRRRLRMSRFWPALLLLLLIPAAGLLWIWWDGADSVDTAAINSAASGSVPPARAVWLPAIIMRSESITAVPAATRTPLPTITPLPSQTPTPTDTPSPTGPPPTQTPTPLPATDVPIADTCGPPRNWVRVTVQRGQTLYSLARSRGTSVAAVLQANCMRGTALSTGQTLYLPAQAIVVPTTVGTAVATIPAGSGQPAYFISAPAPGSRLQGQVSIVGTVDFVPAPGWFYKVEIGAGSAPAQWTTLGSLHAQPVQQAVLEELWVDAFAAGSYTLRLILVDHTGNYVGSPYEVPVVLEPGE